jgi:ketosteroid isomerase-like protein
MSDDKIEIIRRKYEALGRGDLDAILADVADDVDWVSVSAEGSPAVPWYGRYRGLTEVPRFFEELGSSVDITEFTPLSFTSNETDVMVAIRWAFTARATGRSAVLPMQHWWRFADGRVVSVLTAEDSERTAAAFGQPSRLVARSDSAL